MWHRAEGAVRGTLEWWQIGAEHEPSELAGVGRARVETGLIVTSIRLRGQENQWDVGGRRFAPD